MFFFRTQYRISILWYKYPMRPFSLHIYKGNERMGIRKIKKKGIRGIENKGNKGNRYPSGTHGQVCWVSQIRHASCYSCWYFSPRC
jgi:hypothetical protein